MSIDTDNETQIEHDENLMRRGLRKFYYSMGGLALFAFVGNFAWNYYWGYSGDKEQEAKIRNSKVCSLRLTKDELPSDWITSYIENEGKGLNPYLLLRELYELNNKPLSLFNSDFEKYLDSTKKEIRVFDLDGNGKSNLGNGLELRCLETEGINHTQFSYGDQLGPSF